MDSVHDLSQLDGFIFGEHAAYAPKPTFNASETDDLDASYGAGGADNATATPL